MGDDNHLEDEELQAWRAFVSAHGRMFRKLDHELVQVHDLRLAEYEVLEHLADTPDGHLRMNELAERCGLSPSGLTRRFDSMVREGLVERERCDDDRRGVYAVITQLGKDRLGQAEPVHTAGVRRMFVEPLGRGELPDLAHALDRVATAGNGRG
ncbi:MAG TPA: MarR family transcriptional regulator [Microthrixaceae bacterium]|nr:MarR family transcriptional regulator [Microthrixaceae bacterium]